MNRTTRRTLVAFTAALLLAPLASLQAADPPSLAGSFPLGVYWPWERTEGLAKRNGLEKWAFVERSLDNLTAQGFDAVWAVNLGPGDGTLLEKTPSGKPMRHAAVLPLPHRALPGRAARRPVNQR